MKSPTIIQHFENWQQVFNTDAELLTFVKLIFHENEEEDTLIPIPHDKESALQYIDEYCPNFSIVG